jgi:hypothetical protein
MMALTITFLLTIPGFREKCDTHNVENLVLKFSEYDSRKLSCYPGTVGVCFAFLFSLFFNITATVTPRYISFLLSFSCVYKCVCYSHGARGTLPSPLHHVTRVINYPPTSCE